MTPDTLQNLLKANDAEGCIAGLASLTESERRKLARLAAAELRSLTAVVRITPALMQTMTSAEAHALMSRPEPDPATRRAAQAAVLATGSFAEWKRFGLRCVPPIEDAVAILSSRRPPWVGEWAEQLLAWSEAERWPNSLETTWPYVRRLIRAGLCDRLRSTRYFEGMILALSPRSGGGDFVQNLLDDPGLLDEEIWEIFVTEPTRGQLSILPTSRFDAPGLRWEVTLARLAAAGRIERSRLLDGSLDGLERGFHESRAKWFAALHDELSPTLDERAERVARTLGLLASHNASTVVFALQGLTLLDKADRLEPRALLDEAGPALQARAKGTVLLAIELIDRAARRDPSLRSRAVALAVEALAHESPDVHRAVIDLLADHGDPTDRTLGDLVRVRVDSVAASERPRLALWLGTEQVETEPPAARAGDDLLARAAALDPRFAELAGVPAAVAAVQQGGGDLAAIRFTETDTPRLDPARQIKPVADLDELVGLFSRLIEDAEAADDLERLLDGVSRLCDQIPADFAARTAPLRARAAQLEFGPICLRDLALGWIDGEPCPIRVARGDRTLFAIFERRAAAVAARAAARKAAPTLAAPTHRGGWIDPRVLVARLRTWASLSSRLDRLDAAQALLRLAPDPLPRAEALRDAAGLVGPVAAALRHALGGEGETVGPDARLWVAAARARSPLGDDLRVEARHPGLGPDAARAATCSLRPGSHQTGHWVRLSHRNLIHREPPSPPAHEFDLPTVLMHHKSAWFWSPGFRWTALVWPMVRESFFAMGVEHLVGHDRSVGEVHSCRQWLEPLLDPDVPLRAMGQLLLAGALAANQPELRGLATDALIAAVADGRIDGPTLGAAIWPLLLGRLAPPSRLVKTLADAARVSPLHARVVARGLQAILKVETVATRDLAGLLELLRELLIETGEALTVDGVGEFLHDLRGSGKAARLAKSLVELRADPRSSSRALAAARALEGRIERAERWMRAGGG